MPDSVGSVLPAGVRQWQDGGRLLNTGAGSVFVRSAPGTGAGPTVLLLHGFPSSSYDFRGVVDQLGGRAWLTLDFLGFGLPPGAPSLGELVAQAKSNLQAPWLGISAFAVLALMLSLLVFIGEAARDAFDPRK